MQAMAPNIQNLRQNVNAAVACTENVAEILGWPTHVVSIDWRQGSQGDQCIPAHTYIFFVPGNPGLVGWYIPALTSIVQQLGPGFSLRGVSYAGHGVTEEVVNVEPYQDDCNTHDANNCRQARNVQIPWSIQGQIQHKLAWIDHIHDSDNLETKRLVFVSHSIGAHMVQRMLVLRPDWRRRTAALVHWMPFLRMDPDTRAQQYKLYTAAHHPDAVIAIGRKVLEVLRSRTSLVNYMLKRTAPDDRGRDLAVRLLQHPTFIRNFFELGTEELRDVPQLPDISALRLLSSIPTFILHCPGDPWFPHHHADDIIYTVANKMPATATRTTTTTTTRCSSSRSSSGHDQTTNTTPPSIQPNIALEYCSTCQHDFIVHPDMVPIAVDFVVKAIRQVTMSRL